jgi:hypothetical protein
VNGFQELLKETVRERVRTVPATRVPWAALRRRRRQHRLRVATAAAAASVVALALLTVSPFGGVRLLQGDGPPPAGTTVADSRPTKPSELLGIWRVRSSSGSALLLLNPSFVTLVQNCLKLDGSWVATPDGHFAATRVTGAQQCGQGGIPDDVQLPGWLTGAVRWRAEGRGWALVGRDGGITARLTRTTSKDPLLHSGQISHWKRDQDAVYPPLPAGHRAVTDAELAGRWFPLGTTTDAPEIEFGPDGMQRYVIDDQGGVWITDDGSYHNDCKVPPGGIPDECAETKTWFNGGPVAYEHGRLVVYGAEGEPVHTLVRR